ncbi:MAG: S41 family peptidase [Duganella sp.]
MLRQPAFSLLLNFDHVPALKWDEVYMQYLSKVMARRVRRGDEIIAIDGEPARRYAEQRVMPFVSSSTPQDRDVRTYGYQLLAGDEKQPVRLRLRGADGAEREELVERSLPYRAPDAVGFKMLPGQIAYIALDQFENDREVKAFERALPEILKARGLVIDVRRNGGGSTDFGLAVLSYLSREPIKRDVYPDGTAFVGKGIHPDIEVR